MCGALSIIVDVLKVKFTLALIIFFILSFVNRGDKPELQKKLTEEDDQLDLSKDDSSN